MSGSSEGTDLPDFVTPIPLGGEEGPPLELPPDIVKELAALLDEFRAARARALINAHRVVIWR